MEQEYKGGEKPEAVSGLSFLTYWYQMYFEQNGRRNEFEQTR